MACNCRHNAENIRRDAETLEAFRRYFIRRMTVDGSSDARKKDFNRSIFNWDAEDIDEADPAKTWACYAFMDMGMVLNCFDDAMRDFRKRFCDQHERSRFET